MAFFRQERGQNSIEYLLVVGTVAVVMLGAMIFGFQAFLPQVVGSLCSSVDTADPAATTGSCLKMIPTPTPPP